LCRPHLDIAPETIMDEPMRDPPFPDACRTGRAFITPCCTAKQTEYMVDGVLYLSFYVVGRGWFPARPGSIDSINDDGTIIEKDGSSRRIRWRAGQECS